MCNKNISCCFLPRSGSFSTLELCPFISRNIGNTCFSFRGGAWNILQNMKSERCEYFWICLLQYFVVDLERKYFISFILITNISHSALIPPASCYGTISYKMCFRKLVITRFYSDEYFSLIYWNVICVRQSNLLINSGRRKSWIEYSLFQQILFQFPPSNLSWRSNLDV